MTPTVKANANAKKNQSALSLTVTGALPKCKPPAVLGYHEDGTPGCTVLPRCEPGYIIRGTFDNWNCEATEALAPRLQEQVEYQQETIRGLNGQVYGLELSCVILFIALFFVLLLPLHKQGGS